jgi:hypothetical protein
MGNMECTNPKTGAVEDMCEQGKCECISKAQLGEDCTANLKDLGDSLSVMVCDSGLQCLDATGMACEGSSGDVSCTCEMMEDDLETALAQNAEVKFRYSCDDIVGMCKTRRCANAAEDKKGACLSMCDKRKSVCECRRPVIIQARTVCRPMGPGEQKNLCYENVRDDFKKCWQILKN